MFNEGLKKFSNGLFSPTAYFWVGNGSMPNIMGVKVPNELGSYDVLRGYQGEDIEIQLPGNLTVYDIDW